MKKISVLMLVFVVMLSSCALRKTPITGQDFISKLSEMEFNITDLKEEQYKDAGHVITALLAVDPTESFAIEFYEFQTQAQASGFFTSNSSDFDQIGSGVSTKLSGLNWASHAKTAGGAYSFVSYIDTVLIFSRVHEEHRQTIQNIIKELESKNPRSATSPTQTTTQIQTTTSPSELNPESDFTVESNATGVTITGYTGTAKDVVIPQTIGGRPVTAIAQNAFRNKQLTSVILPHGVTNIGYTAFQDNQLITVTIPNSVTEILSGAFLGNQITSITIGANVTMGLEYEDIDYGTFNNNFVNFYNVNGKQAGTYTFNNGAWSRR